MVCNTIAIPFRHIYNMEVKLSTQRANVFFYIDLTIGNVRIPVFQIFITKLQQIRRRMRLK